MQQEGNVLRKTRTAAFTFQDSDELVSTCDLDFGTFRCGVVKEADDLDRALEARRAQMQGQPNGAHSPIGMHFLTDEAQWGVLKAQVIETVQEIPQYGIASWSSRYKPAMRFTIRDTSDDATWTCVLLMRFVS